MPAYTNHEYSNLFPMMGEGEYAELKFDIKANGLLEPITLYQNQILDGRNRYKACDELGIVPKFIDYEGDNPLSHVISLNLFRRHLTTSQRAALAVELLPKFEEEAKRRMESGINQYSPTQKFAEATGEAREQVADLFKTNRQYVSDAKKIAENKPELFEQIKDGTLTISDAKQVIRKENIKQQKQDIETGKVELPTGKFEAIVIDPPWPYGTQYDPETRRVANPYPEMSIEDIGRLELPVSEDCVLWLWTTHKFLPDAFDLMRLWGFEYKATLVWNKQKIGMGNWLRMQCEFCLLGIKGKPLWDNTKYTDVIDEPRREHSRKPESFYQLVNALCVGRKLDYFSRESREGWYQYGNDTNKF